MVSASRQPQSARLRSSRLNGFRDHSRFLKEWLGNPMRIGAVAPSGPDLARTMASFVDASESGAVLELGPGTGIVTQAILDHGVASDQLFALEYCSDFAKVLGQRFDGVTVLQGDAYDPENLKKPCEAGPLSAVVSSLPLFTQPQERRRALLINALSRLKPGAPFIQFSYALVPPVPAEPAFTLTKTSWILRNVPPARVWVYRCEDPASLRGA